MEEDSEIVICVDAGTDGKGAKKSPPVRLSNKADPSEEKELRKAAKKGDVEAKFKWAYGCLTKKMTGMTEVEAIKMLTTLSDQGNYPDIELTLGMYNAAIGNMKETMVHYTKAAVFGQHEAMLRLASLLEDLHQEREAIAWMKKAASTADEDPNDKHKNEIDEKARCEAMVMLGLRYLGGNGVLRDDRKGAEIIREAAERNHIPAVKLYGRLFLRARGVVRDKKRALLWFAKAAHLGDDDAAFTVGRWLTESKKESKRNRNRGERGIAVHDWDRGIKWLELAAKRGNNDALLLLGDRMMAGDGFRHKGRDRKKGVEYYEEAMNKGSAEGRMKLVNCYRNGIGVEKDEKKADELVNEGKKKAAKSDDDDDKE